MKALGCILVMLCAATFSSAAQEVAVAAADSVPLHGNWVQQLAQAHFSINDPRISYPKFPNFCRKVYNWANDTFNTYDTAYVVATGKNWKFIIDSTNEMQRYGYLFDIQSDSNLDLVSIRSNLTYDIGARLSFMAVSIGYTLNINDLLSQTKSARSTFNFSFTCARFSAEIISQSVKGNTYIERFGRYNNGRGVHIDLDNTRHRLRLFSGYYFFNHSKYSQAAAYSFSKYQRRSAGSWLVGARYNQQKLTIDFTNLPAEVLTFKPATLPLLNQYDFHDICAQAGYAHNFVFPHNWLLNITILPGIGYRRSLIRGKRDASEMVATNVDGRLSLVYNYRALFANLQARWSGNFLFNSGYSFLMASEYFSLRVGVRF